MAHGRELGEMDIDVDLLDRRIPLPPPGRFTRGARVKSKLRLKIENMRVGDRLVAKNNPSTGLDDRLFFARLKGMVLRVAKEYHGRAFNYYRAQDGATVVVVREEDIVST